MAVIALTDVSYVYPESETQTPALSNVNFTIQDGEFLCLVGHSGCGKSTLLSLLAGLALPTSGTITIDGKPLAGPSTTRAMVFQHYSLFPWMTVQKNVSFSIRHANKNISRSEALCKAQTYLAKVGMAAQASSYPFQLSGGMQQRVAIARALAMESEVLLLDEPFGALDAKNRAELQNLLYELWSGAPAKRTIVFVTHDLDEALLLGDRIAFMSPGTIEESLTIDLPRPRNFIEIEKSQTYQELRSSLLALFYRHEEKSLFTKPGEEFSNVNS